MTAGAEDGGSRGEPVIPARFVVTITLLAAAVTWCLMPAGTLEEGVGAECAEIIRLADDAPGLAAILDAAAPAVTGAASALERTREALAGMDPGEEGPLHRACSWLGGRTAAFTYLALAAVLRLCLLLHACAWLAPPAACALAAVSARRAVSLHEFSWSSPFRMRSAAAVACLPPAAAAAALILPVRLPVWVLPMIAAAAIPCTAAWLGRLQKEI